VSGPLLEESQANTEHFPNYISGKTSGVWAYVEVNSRGLVVVANFQPPLVLGKRTTIERRYRVYQEKNIEAVAAGAALETEV
jgi:hypothetical protein